MTRKTASVVQPGKVTKGKRNTDQLSQATIARRQKKVQIAEEKLQLLEKHKEDLAIVQDGDAEADVMHELKVCFCRCGPTRLDRHELILHLTSLRLISISEKVVSKVSALVALTNQELLELLSRKSRAW